MKIVCQAAGSTRPETRVTPSRLKITARIFAQFRDSLRNQRASSTVKAVDE